MRAVMLHWDQSLRSRGQHIKQLYECPSRLNSEPSVYCSTHFYRLIKGYRKLAFLFLSTFLHPDTEQNFSNASEAAATTLRESVNHETTTAFYGTKQLMKAKLVRQPISV